MSVRRRMAVSLTGVLVVGAVLTSSPATAAPSDPAPVAVVGDFGSGTDEERRVADLVAGRNPTAVVTTGDNVYDSNDYARLVGDYYGRWVASGDLLPTAGNHDHAEGIAAFDAYFPYLKGRHVYSVGRGGMRFFILDSDVALASPTSLKRQKAWLKRSLTSSPARWKVVVLHHPPFSSGAVHGSTPEMQWPFGAWGADLVISGHEHSYERIEDAGTTYVVNGAGGKDLYGFGDPVAGSAVRYDADHGALFLTASAGSLTGEFRAADGAVVDRFTMRP